MDARDLINIAGEKVESFNSKELKDVGFIPLDDLYFPAIYYPPIPMYPQSNEEEMLANFKYNNNEPLIYIHIPFCLTKCLYCHWVTSVGNSQEEIDCYLENLEKEMDIWKERLDVKVISPKSVLIGGGTPSILAPAQTKRLLKSFRSRFDMNRCIQFSLEAEPKTILGEEGIKKLKIMKDYGINRISLGVQSFDDGVLKRMGRAHTSEDAIKAIKQIRDVGFKNLCIDLIYGYPGCTLEKWIKTLEIVLSLDVDGYQLYRLRVIPHGDRKGEIKHKFDISPGVFPSLKEIYLMKEIGILFSHKNEFKETSRRVFSKSQKYGSYYNQYYCSLYNVIGLGISTWNNLQDRFFLKTGENLESYYSYLKKGKLPIDRGKVRTDDDTKRWAVALPLKHNGVSKNKYKAITGVHINEAFGEKIKRLKNYGLLEENDESLVLTEKGRFFADEVIIQFYHPDYIPFPRSSYSKGELNPYNAR